MALCLPRLAGASLDEEDQIQRTAGQQGVQAYGTPENGWAAEHHLAEYANVRECRLRHHLISH